MRRRVMALLLLLIASSAAARAPDDIIEPLMARFAIPGMAIAVLNKGQTTFYSYGVTSVPQGAPVTSRTLFEIGSLSKTFTATLASYAVQQNKMQLRDSASQWLPALQGSALDRVTLLNLATHTSGMPLFVPEEVTDNAQLMQWYKSWQPEAEPGTQRVYSNLGIGLLGMRNTACLFKPGYRPAGHDRGEEPEYVIYARYGIDAPAGDGDASYFSSGAAARHAGLCTGI